MGGRLANVKRGGDEIVEVFGPVVVRIMEDGLDAAFRGSGLGEEVG